MVEGKFEIPKELSESKLIQLIEEVRIKVSELSGIEVSISKSQIPGWSNTATYLIRGNGVKVSIMYNPEAASKDRAKEGLAIYVGAEQEEEIYKNIIEILNLNGRKP